MALEELCDGCLRVRGESSMQNVESAAQLKSPLQQ